MQQQKQQQKQTQYAEKAKQFIDNNPMNVVQRNACINIWKKTEKDNKKYRYINICARNN